MKKSNLIGKRLFNNMPLPSYVGGHRLLNAGGAIDPNSAGYRYIIDTLTYIRESIVEQKFYEIAIADFFPVDIGEGAWMEDIVQNVVFKTGGSFFQGDIDTQEYTGRMASVGAGIDKLSMPTKGWGKNTGWTIVEIAKAAAANKWDVVEAKLGTLKKDWDLGIQEVGILGHPDGTLSGLLNDAEVNINTTLITTPVSSMTPTQFTAFVKGALSAYFTNSKFTTGNPNVFVMPTNDYLGLGVPYDDGFPNVSRLDYLLNLFRQMTANPSFEILPLAYAQSENNSGAGIGKNRYVLYKNDPETLKMTIPVDFTMLEAKTVNGFNWEQVGYGQYSGVMVNRKLEVLYFDETAS